MNIQNLQQKKWYVTGSDTKGSYSHHNPIKFLTGWLESSLCEYSNAYISVTGDIAVKRRNAANAADIELAAAILLLHHLKIVEQKWMVILLIIQVLLMLQCLFTIWLNIVTVILKFMGF